MATFVWNTHKYRNLTVGVDCSGKVNSEFIDQFAEALGLSEDSYLRVLPPDYDEDYKKAVKEKQKMDLWLKKARKKYLPLAEDIIKKIHNGEVKPKVGCKKLAEWCESYDLSELSDFKKIYGRGGSVPKVLAACEKYLATASNYVLKADVPDGPQP